MTKEYAKEKARFLEGIDMERAIDDGSNPIQELIVKIFVDFKHQTCRYCCHNDFGITCNKGIRRPSEEIETLGSENIKLIDMSFGCNIWEKKDD